MATGFLVLTAVGPDPVGIVDEISGAVTGAGCNIEESKMAVLSGELAVIMLVSGAAASEILRLYTQKVGVRIPRRTRSSLS